MMMIIIMTIDADSLVVFVYSLIYLVFFTIHIPIVFRAYLCPPPPLSLFQRKRKRKKERQKQTKIPPKKTTKPNH